MEEDAGEAPLQWNDSELLNTEAENAFESERRHLIGQIAQGLHDVASNMHKLNVNMERMAEKSKEVHELGKAWLEFYAKITAAPPAPSSFPIKSLQQDEATALEEEEEGD